MRRIKSRSEEQKSPYTGKLVALAKQQVAAIIDKTLKDDARSGMSAIAA